MVVIFAKNLVKVKIIMMGILLLRKLNNGEVFEN